MPSDAFQGVALGEVVAQNGITNVGTMYINNDYGQGLADAFKAAFASDAGKAAGADVAAHASDRVRLLTSEEKVI